MGFHRTSSCRTPWPFNTIRYWYKLEIKTFLRLWLNPPAYRSRLSRKRTVAGSPWRWPQDWWAGGTLPSPQVCPTCLAEDLKSCDRVQFIRLRWQCAAMTICPKHLVPMLEACSQCHQTKWPICEAMGFGRFRFLCDECGSSSGDHATYSERERTGSSPSAGVRNTIDSRASRLQRSMVWIGHATPAEFLSLVTDLLWIIRLSDCDLEKPIYQLQTACFPLGHRCVPSRPSMHWGLGSPNVRRCMPCRGFGGLRKFSDPIFTREPAQSNSGWGQLLSLCVGRRTSESSTRCLDWPPAT